jgi:hypothetical protein
LRLWRRCEIAAGWRSAAKFDISQGRKDFRKRAAQKTVEGDQREARQTYARNTADLRQSIAHDIF